MSLPDELAQVRAEIKTWERSFRAENGRDPSRDDIKAVPEITLKYKLYKSLSKSKDLPASSTSSSQPSTQSRPPARPPVRPLDKTPTSSTRSFFRSVSSISTSFSTPVADDMSNPFLETTPVLTKRGSARGKPATPVQDSGDNPFLSPLASVGGKKGSTSTGSGSQSQQLAHQPSTPGRRGSRPYGASVPDPSFPDPFASPSKPRQNSIAGPMRTPGKPRRSSEVPDAGTMPGQGVGESAGGFLFAPSPSRLKSLLEANSLSRSPSKSSPGAGPSATRGSGVGITPRTKARKRLRGEEVDETPRRPKGRSGTFFSSDPVGRSDDLEEEKEEEFGPTPKKPVDGGRKGGFKILFGVDEDTDEEHEGRIGTAGKKVGGDEPGASGMAKMFKKRKIEQEPPVGEDKGKSNARSDANGKRGADTVTMNGSQGAGPPTTPSKSALDIGQSPRSATQSTPLKGKKLALLAMLDKEDDDTPVEPEVRPDLDLSPEDKGRIRVEDDLVREIEWSDSDPEVEPDAPLDGSGMALDGAPRRRMTKVIKIEPYRLDQQRRVAAAGVTVQARDLRTGGRQFERTTSSASTGSRSKAKTIVRDPDEPEEELTGNSDETDGLSRLTIRSPENDVLRKTMAYHERKAMAIFSTKAANDLRLRRKGIEIYAAGEGFEGENEDGEADEYGREDEGSEGDDDWDSEPEGWKKVGLGVDDDW